MINSTKPGPAVAALALAVISGPALAQPGNQGAYAAIIEVSGTRTGPEVTYRARLKATLPVTGRNASSITADFLNGEATNASVLVSQWDISHKDKHADSGGRFNSWTCTLAAPVEVPVMATGILDVNLKRKTHAYSLAALSTREIDFNCRHSSSGPYKKKMGIDVTVGTGVPGMHFETQLPFSDPASLAAKFTLAPPAGAAFGPIVQAWEMKLAR